MPSFNDLLQKYIREELTQEELDAFLVLVREPTNQAAVKEAIAAYAEAATYTDLSGGMDAELQFRRVMERARKEVPAVEPAPVRSIPAVRRWWWVAASVIFILAAGAYLFLNNRPDSAAVAQQPVDIKPGTEGAILTLADGTRVVLDSLGNGTVASQNGARIILNDGRITYDPTGITDGGITYNTMATPRGRQFQLVLPDGTKVWLNAASSIKYPTAFREDERSVEITGEAYFEVAKNKTRPFRVNINNQATVEVLGTHFNINAYSNGTSIQTTLLEGSVRFGPVSGPHSSAILRPGEQGRFPVSGASSGIRIESADIDKVMAWKNGFFNFDGLPITEVMNMLERWYDITVVYEKGVPDIEFFGEINRNMNLSDLIVALKDVGVHFRIEAGRKLVVLP
jgi:ferric-dicitrate binding protein FerR (iron transport regulator)